MSLALIIVLSLIGLGAIAFLIYGNRLPASWEVRESATVKASREELYDYLVQIKNWEHWTIWSHEVNPAFEFEYEGPASGPGATQCWKAKGKFGKTKICSGDRPNQINYMFSFGHGHHMLKGSIELKPRGCETEVVWLAMGDCGESPAKRIMAHMMTPYMQKDFHGGLSRLQKVFADRPVGNCEQQA
jgi:hypothetical protein